MPEGPSYDELMQLLGLPQTNVRPQTRRVEVLKDEADAFCFRMINRYRLGGRLFSVSYMAPGAFGAAFVLFVIAMIALTPVLHLTWEEGGPPPLGEMLLGLSPVLLFSLGLFLVGMRLWISEQRFDVRRGHPTCQERGLLGWKLTSAGAMKIARKSDSSGQLSWLLLTGSSGKTIRLGLGMTDPELFWLMAKMAAVLGPESVASPSATGKSGHA
jgi:hypothetical protein